jgi:putative membrane protein
MTAAAWALFAATMYLIVASALGHWVHLPILGDIGFTLVFVLFAVTHCIAYEGPRRTAVFFALSAFVCFCMEEIGVRTGLIYGAYHYSDMLGAKLGHVPIIIPLAYFMMIYPSWMVARMLLRGIKTDSVAGITALATVAALVVTAWDVVMDPGMARAGNWIWEHGGAYFGVPRRNFLGWLLTTFIVYWIAAYYWSKLDRRHTATKMFAGLPLLVYAAYGLHYLAPNRIPEMQVIALFAMVVPGVLALMQCFLPRNDMRQFVRRASDGTDEERRAPAQP